MPDKNGMTSAWLDFEKKTMHHITNPVQIDETMKAFKAGYFSCFLYLTTEVARLPEEQALKAMEEVNAEVEAFVKEIFKRTIAQVLEKSRKPL